MVKKRIPYWQDQPMKLSEWQEAIEKNLLSLNQDLNRLVQNSLKQPTIAPATQNAPTEEEQWAVAVDTHLKMIESLQSGQADTQNGPVGPGSDCVHNWRWLEGWLGPWQKSMKFPMECKKCHALTWFVATPAQGVDPILSTSVKQPLKESVESSQEESVQSQSKELTEDQLHWLDVGGEMALTTVKRFIEGRLAIKRSDFKE